MKDVVGYEDKYAVDEAGNVWSKTRQIYVKHYIDRKGYPRVGLWLQIDGQWRQKNKLVHRLVAETFIENPENKPIAHHIDGDTMHCHVSNLAWATAKENVQDGFDRGRQSWNKDMKSTANMTLEDLARELPRLQAEAKALWGEELVTNLENKYDLLREAVHVTADYPSGYDFDYPLWIWHLQQMVIAEDPIKYLENNMKGES